MKKSILFTMVALTPLFTCSLFAVPTKLINRTKTGCFPGCNSVSRTETIMEVEGANGKKYNYTQVDISCSGTGVSSCPTEMAAPPATHQDPFTETCGNALFDYAIDQIALGNATGNHSQNYFNASTGETWRFSAVWTTTVGGVETIEVFMEFLY